MTLPGETLATGASRRCPTCGTAVSLTVLASGAGWYVGTHCACGPYTRESGYYATAGDAQHALFTGQYVRG